MSRVFISYAHTEADTALARNLEKWLATAGLETWLDESQMPPGTNYHDAIPTALEKCDAALFLVSRSWIDRTWTNYELQLLASRDLLGKTIPRIAVMRAPECELTGKTPPELSLFAKVDWIDGRSAESDAESLYQIYCGILKQAPGSRDGWAEKGKPWMKGGIRPSPAPLFRPRVARRDFYPSLECGRANEFMSVKQSCAELYHQVAVIAAPRGEGHNRFKKRIEVKLEMESGSKPIIYPVDWSVHPVSQTDYLERLRCALSDDRSLDIEGLPQLLQETLAEKNVILMHETLESSDYRRPHLLEYYTHWLPELVKKAKPKFCLKCIQPVEWDAGEGFRKLARNLAARFIDADWFCTVEEREALGFMQKVLEADSIMKPTKIPLSPVLEADVEQFCTIKQFSAAERLEIRARTRRGRQVRTSEEVFTAIDDYLLNVRLPSQAEGATL